MRILIACLSLALGASTLAAQEGHGTFRGKRGGGTDAVKSALNLSDEQVTALRQNNQELREAMKAVFEQAGEKHQAIKAELENASPNPTVIGQLVIEAHAAREQTSEIRTQYHQKALAILDSSQQTALTALKDSEERSPALREAVWLNLVEMDREAFDGRGGPRGGHRGGPGGFMGGPRG